MFAQRTFGGLAHIMRFLPRSAKGRAVPGERVEQRYDVAALLVGRWTLRDGPSELARAMEGPGLGVRASNTQEQSPR